ncbi:MULTISPECIES: hypothetical protein [unclassified Caldibacillus]|nr:MULTISPECIES: hypothetical protein [unclassified Caldibacillus]
MKTHASRQFQENIDQYKMPEAVKTSKKGYSDMRQQREIIQI